MLSATGQPEPLKDRKNMEDRLNLEAKSDRELLLLTAQRSNEMCRHLERLNDKVAKNEKRITEAERKLLIMETREHTTTTLSRRQITGWGSLVVAAISIIVVIVSKVIEIAW
jgi:hypothetical protein